MLIDVGQIDINAVAFIFKVKHTDYIYLTSYDIYRRNCSTVIKLLIKILCLGIH